MRRGWTTLLIAVAVALVVAAPAAAAQRLVFDAKDGVLRDASGHRLGTFQETCTASERCSGSARTADGRLRFHGRGSATAPGFTWRLTGASGRYRGARGTLALHVVSDTEWVAAASVRSPAELRAGAVRDRQDAAALAADVPAFVASVDDTVAAERELALAADVFGATRCT
jgi:hypothetical protein